MAGLLIKGATRGEYATATVRSHFRLTLHRDGRLTNARVVGGVRNESFDRAVLHALVALDSTRLLPAPNGFEDSFDQDTLPMRAAGVSGPQRWRR